MPDTSREKWTQPADIVKKLKRRWVSGALLSAYASGQPWEPESFPLHGPKISAIAGAFGEVQDWIRSLESGRTKGKNTRYRLSYRDIGGRGIGSNRLPERLWIDSYHQVWLLLGVLDEAAEFDRLLDHTKAHAPQLIDWVTRKPLRALAHAEMWPLLLSSIAWIEDNPRPDLYLRHLDVPGVHTKFLEQHRGVLADLLDEALPEERIDRDASRMDLAARFGYRRKPEYIRFRLLEPDPQFPASASEMALPAEDLARIELAAPTIFVIENEITYLAFPDVADAAVIFGAGFALGTLSRLPWLASKEIVYWGDIDTHGYAILNRLRRRFPKVRSMLMDRATLFAYEGQWGAEQKPTNAQLDSLTDDERDLYRDLVEDAFGPKVRLEQERIRMSTVDDSLTAPRD